MNLYILSSDYFHPLSRTKFAWFFERYRRYLKIIENWNDFKDVKDDAICIMFCRGILPPLFDGKAFRFILVFANHFLEINRERKELFQKMERRLILIYENDAQLDHLFYTWGVKLNKQQCLLFPQNNCNQTKRTSLNRCAEIQKSLLKSLVTIDNSHFVTCGSITLFRQNAFWWQDYLGVNNLLPDRYTLHELGPALGITVHSVIIDDNRSWSLFNRIVRVLLISFGSQKRAASRYYKKSLNDIFQSSIFFFSPLDVSGVIPQIVFEAMRSGLVLIAKEAPAFQKLGFKPNIHYISVGNQFSYTSCLQAISFAKSLNVNDILELRERSLNLLNKLDQDSERRFIELDTRLRSPS